MSKKIYYIWVMVFIIGMMSIIGGLYYATRQIDYNWHWHRISRYFVYEGLREITTDLEGEVGRITLKDEIALIIVQNQQEKATYKVNARYIQVREGDMIFKGDVLATDKTWKAGILMQGLWLTLKVSIVAIIIGILIGLLGGLARVSENPALKWSSIIYIELIRGLPLLVQIFLWYFVLGTLINTMAAKFGLPQVPPLWFGITALACFTGAYVAEIVRTGIQSIHRGQTEAALSLGMNYYQSMVYVILPQARRKILPPLAGQFISLIKDSSLLGIISIRELTKVTGEVATTSLQPFELWFICALLYLVLTFSLSILFQYVERRTLIN